MSKNKKKNKSGVRDLWITNSWRYNGSGVHKSNKYVIPRKQKYKNNLPE